MTYSQQLGKNDPASKRKLDPCWILRFRVTLGPGRRARIGLDRKIFNYSLSEAQFGSEIGRGHWLRLWKFNTNKKEHHSTLFTYSVTGRMDFALRAAEGNQRKKIRRERARETSLFFLLSPLTCTLPPLNHSTTWHALQFYTQGFKFPSVLFSVFFLSTTLPIPL